MPRGIPVGTGHRQSWRCERRPARRADPPSTMLNCTSAWALPGVRRKPMKCWIIRIRGCGMAETGMSQAVLFAASRRRAAGHRRLADGAGSRRNRSSRASSLEIELAGNRPHRELARHPAFVNRDVFRLSPTA